MDHFAVGEGAGRLLAQKVELVEMAQVEPLGYALPYEALWRGGWRQLVDAKEDVALAGDVLHEGDAQFVERDGAQVVVVVADVGQGGVGVRGCPPFSDGGHEVRRVAMVVPFGVLIFGTPDDDAQVVGQGLAPVEVGRFLFVADAKEAEVFAYGLELVALGEHTLAQAFGVAGENVDGVGVGLAHRGKVAPEAFQRAGRQGLVEPAEYFVRQPLEVLRGLHLAPRLFLYALQYLSHYDLRSSLLIFSFSHSLVSSTG